MSGYIESFRGHVMSSECDLMGHMNVQFYNACVSHAMATMFASLGAEPQKMKETRRGFAALEQNNRYHAELLAGDIIHMESGVLKSSSRTLTIHHKLYNSATNQLAYEATVTAAYMDMDKRKATPLDDAIKSRAADLSVNGEKA